jgi:tRNA modification GTPase
MSEAQTTFCVLTPPGAGAVATIAITGPRAWETVREAFRPAGSDCLPSSPDIARFWNGHLGGPPGDRTVVAARNAQSVEIHCHGGVAAVRMLAAELIRRGASEQPLADANCAWSELARAATPRTAAILLDQAHGAYREAVGAVSSAIRAGALEQARERLAELQPYSQLGRHLTRPWRVVVAGAPNVGKSSLVNALVGYQRSVVTPTAGTTRDVVSTLIAIDGWQVELIDTAGRHTAGDELEGQGIARAESATATADLCLWVVDVVSPPAWPETAPVNCLFAINKSDLAPAWDTKVLTDAVSTSARTGAGMSDLCDLISKRLVPSPPTPGMAVPFTPQLADAIAEVLTFLDAGDIDAARSAIGALLQSLRPARFR